MENRLDLQYYFTLVTTGRYTVLLGVGSAYYAYGDPENFDADIYRAAKWISRNENPADALKADTPSQIILDNLSEVDWAYDLWNIFELEFGMLDSVTSLGEFAVEPKDVYSALILNAQEETVSDSASDGMAASDLAELHTAFSECLSVFCGFMKINKGIDLENDAEFKKAIDNSDVDVETEAKNYINDWFKENYPNVRNIE